MHLLPAPRHFVSVAQLLATVPHRQGFTISAAADPPPLHSRVPVPNITHPKKKGEYADAQFQIACLKRRLIPCSPWGDCAPFDFVVVGRQMGAATPPSPTQVSKDGAGVIPPRPIGEGGARLRALRNKAKKEDLVLGFSPGRKAPLRQLPKSKRPTTDDQRPTTPADHRKPTTPTITRVQVKSDWNVDYTHYTFRTTGNTVSHPTYRAADIDFLACYVVVLDLWYIIPVSEISDDQSYLYVFPNGYAEIDKLGRPQPPRETKDYEAFKDRWDLLE